MELSEMHIRRTNGHSDLAHGCFEDKQSGQLRRVLFMQLAILLMQLSCKTHTSKCMITDPFPYLYRYLKPGSVTIGGITSQISMHFEQGNFNNHPHQSVTGGTM